MAIKVGSNAKTTTSNTRIGSAGPAMNSGMTAATWTSAQRAAAQTIIDLMDCAYEFEESFKNFRKTFIAVQFNDVRVKDARQAQMIDEIFAERGYVKKVGGSNIVIQIPRSA